MAKGKMYAAFMNFEKVYDRIGRKVLWDTYNDVWCGKEIIEVSPGLWTVSLGGKPYSQPALKHRA